MEFNNTNHILMFSSYFNYLLFSVLIDFKQLQQNQGFLKYCALPFICFFLNHQICWEFNRRKYDRRE
jgi:hypothetical protein